MKRLLTVSLTIAMMAFCGAASAGQIWTDGNGDGLPDTEPLAATPSTNVTVGVWIDAQSFNWTNYLAYVEWASCLSYVSAQYVITGGSNFPFDNFSCADKGVSSCFGFGGSGFNEGGVDHIGNITFHVETSVSCCVMPIIDIYNPDYVFSQLGAGSSYMLFTSNPGTCYGTQEPSGACCYPDGSCDVQFALDCQAGGGVYQGDGTNCAEANCPQPTGACCYPDFSCAIVSPSECEAAGGAYQGDFTDCSACLGGLEFEACCFPDGSCIDSSIGTCPPGSIPQGEGTSCATFVCPQPTGACCVLGVSCTDNVLEADCTGPNALWYPGVLCSDIESVCLEPDAVESKSWGKIKGLFR
jgi:hypothetical protein